MMKRNKLHYLFYAVMIVAVGIVAYNYICEPYLDYDQAGQFFISQGLNHYSKPFSEPGKLWDVVLNNRDYNKDPGGFSLLLYLWEKGGTGYQYLHLLPFLIFMAFCIILALIVYSQSNSRFIAFATFCLPFFLPVFTNRVAEIRAYGMEMLGVVLTILLIMRYKERLSVGRLLILSTTQSVFCTSRYGFIVVSAALSLRILYLLYRQTRISEFLKRTFVYSLPLIATVATIYLMSMRYQTGVSYYPYIFSTPSLLVKSPLSLLFYACLMSYAYWHHKGAVPELCIDAILVAALFFLLSCANLYPWGIRTISALLLMTFSMLITLFDAFRRWCNILSVVVTTVALMVLIFFFPQIHRNRSKEPFIELCHFISSNRNGRIVITWWHNPSLRYHCEYGFLKNKSTAYYPDRFVIYGGPKHNAIGSEIEKEESVEGATYILLEETTTKRFNHAKGYKHIYLVESPKSIKNMSSTDSH